MSQQLRTVATFPTATQAHFFADQLRDAGIFAAIADEHVVTTDYFLGAAVAGIKVQVREHDLERAEAILQLPRPVAQHEIPWEEGVVENDPDDPLPDPDRDRPDEPEVPVTEGELLVDRAYRSAILGLLFFALPIINILSLVLLLRVAFQHNELPPRANARYYLSFFLNCMAIAAAAWLWLQVGRARDD